MTTFPRSRSIVSHCCLVAAFLGFRSRPALAQTSQSDQAAAWAALAFGVGAPGGTAGILAVTGRYRGLVLRGREAMAGDLLDVDPNTDIGLLAGPILLDRRPFQISVAAGLGWATIDPESPTGGPPSPTTSEVGFLLDVELRLRLTSFFGLVGYAFGDLNREESFGGVVLGAYVGTW